MRSEGIDARQAKVTSEYDKHFNLWLRVCSVHDKAVFFLLFFSTLMRHSINAGSKFQVQRGNWIVVI